MNTTVDLTKIAQLVQNCKDGVKTPLTAIGKILEELGYGLDWEDDGQTAIIYEL